MRFYVEKWERGIDKTESRRGIEQSLVIFKSEVKTIASRVLLGQYLSSPTWDYTYVGEYPFNLANEEQCLYSKQALSEVTEWEQLRWVHPRD